MVQRKQSKVVAKEPSAPWGSGRGQGGEPGGPSWLSSSGARPSPHVWGVCDAQLLPQRLQGLRPALLVVYVEDAGGPAPILNCPWDQLRDQDLQVSVGQQGRKKMLGPEGQAHYAPSSQRASSQLILT